MAAGVADVISYPRRRCRDCPRRRAVKGGTGWRFARQILPAPLLLSSTAIDSAVAGRLAGAATLGGSRRGGLQPPAPFAVVPAYRRDDCGMRPGPTAPFSPIVRGLRPARWLAARPACGPLGGCLSARLRPPWLASVLLRRGSAPLAGLAGLHPGRGLGGLCRAPLLRWVALRGLWPLLRGSVWPPPPPTGCRPPACVCGPLRGGRGRRGGKRGGCLPFGLGRLWWACAALSAPVARPNEGRGHQIRLAAVWPPLPCGAGP